MFIVSHGGKTYDLPFDWRPAPKNRRGKLPNEVMLRFDERSFATRFEKCATWVSGSGPYAVLAYCRELTITRHSSLAEAIKAKGPIDGSGCGGACVGAHLLVYFDPNNGFQKEYDDAVAAYIKDNNIQPSGEAWFARMSSDLGGEE